MKRLTFAAFAFLLIASALPCTAQQKEKRRPGPFLIWGLVHTIRDERVTITMKDGEPVESARVLVTTMTFKEDGTKRAQTFYKHDGTIRVKVISLYDPDGRVLETTDLNDKDVVQLRTVSNYDEKKNLIERISYRADGSILSKQTFTRWGNQTTSEATTYGQNGVILRQSTTNTGPQTNRTEAFFYDGNRVVRSESSVTRTPEGEMLEAQEDGKTTRKDAYNSLGRGGYEHIQYNPDGTIKSRERFTREFDSHGNVIKVTESVATGDSTDFVLVDVTYRTIEYYQ